MVFEEKGATVKQEINAKQEVYNGEDAWKVVAGVKRIVVASGKKTLEYDPATSDKDELLKKITGRTGNLRAPALRIGDVYYIGFNVEMYENLK
jgi:hypothetical protein